MALRNYVENVVLQEYRNYVANHPEFCRCSRCRDDLLALTLNRLPGHYVTSEEGSIRADAEVQVNRQLRVDVVKAMYEAASIVQAHPHHGPDQRGTG
ncbi:MAG: late competence development ComFB family protein [Firmicutes bacterium]|nr:late competence development ComFB family protein [Bacillota bacterium]